MDFNSGEGASLLPNEVGRAGLPPKLRTLSPFAECFGAPKSSFLAGLLGPLRIPIKCAGVPLADIGLLMVFSGEKIPSALRMRRLAGLYKFGPPGDSGRLLGRDLVVNGRLGFSGRNWSRGSS